MKLTRDMNQTSLDARCNTSCRQSRKSVQLVQHKTILGVLSSQLNLLFGNLWNLRVPLLPLSTILKGSMCAYYMKRHFDKIPVATVQTIYGRKRSVATSLDQTESTWEIISTTHSDTEQKLSLTSSNNGTALTSIRVEDRGPTRGWK